MQLSIFRTIIIFTFWVINPPCCLYYNAKQAHFHYCNMINDYNNNNRTFLLMMMIIITGINCKVLYIMVVLILYITSVSFVFLILGWNVTDMFSWDSRCDTLRSEIRTFLGVFLFRYVWSLETVTIPTLFLFCWSVSLFREVFCYFGFNLNAWFILVLLLPYFIPCDICLRSLWLNKYELLSL